jgi:hypothetical protein
LQQYPEALAACEQLIQFKKDRLSVDREINGLVIKMLLLQESLKRPVEALRVVDQALTLLRLRMKTSLFSASASALTLLKACLT